MRLWVYRALVEVVLNRTYSNLYLRHHLSSLDVKDRSLATRIFYGTIQNYRYCEYVWQQYARKKVKTSIQVLLTMSVYQLLFLDTVPAYAIVNDAVTIAKSVHPRSKGFVNALLHRIDSDHILLPDDPIQRLAIQYSCPDWLVRMWQAQYGYEQMMDNIRSTIHILPMYVRRNPLQISSEAFEADPMIHSRVSGLYEYTGPSISSNDMYLDGKMSVQDIGSYEISCWMDPKPGDLILDCCCAPGTKTFAMAEMMKDIGHIDSLDLYPHRVKLIENDKRRLRIHCVYPQCKDATKMDDLGLYDKVLCDVPCSGYGVMARKPDIKLHMDPTDMDALIPLQKAILESASQHVKPGGILVYSTCTLNKKENEKQVDAFLRAHTAFKLIRMKTLFPSKRTDGFFIALMKFSENLI